MQTPVRNSLEADYAQHLEARLRAGEIIAYSYESTTFDLDLLGNLRTCNRCTYTPDFTVTLPDGSIEQHEVKGFWREDAAIKFKLAAAQHPDQRFYKCTRKTKKTPWKIVPFKLKKDIETKKSRKPRRASPSTSPKTKRTTSPTASA